MVKKGKECKKVIATQQMPTPAGTRPAPGRALQTRPPAAELAGVRPAPGPGQDMTPTILMERWASSSKTKVVDFYGHRPNMGDWACFSNFYDQRSCPFEFVLPPEFDGVGLAEDERRTQCNHSEKAIMLCKAAIMGDYPSYTAIREALSPADAKALGRFVQNFNNDLWHNVVCSVAFEVVFQKFSKTQILQPLLLATGNKVMCEATRNDRNWGIGIDRGDPRCQNPPEWIGSNMLGWALMEVRSVLSAGIPAPEQAHGSGPSQPKHSRERNDRKPEELRQGAASSQPTLTASPGSTLSPHEKNFLDACRVVRAIWKIEAQKAIGAKIARNQQQKLDKKSDALKEVQDLLGFLAVESDLRQKNKDVVEAAVAADASPLGTLQGQSSLTAHDAVTRSRQKSEGPALDTKAELEVPNPATASVEPREIVDEDHDLPSLNGETPAPLELERPKHIPVVVEAQVAVEDEEAPLLPSDAAAKSTGKARRNRARGGRSHGVRKYEAAHGGC